jgi:hypothetical protein
MSSSRPGPGHSFRRNKVLCSAAPPRPETSPSYPLGGRVSCLDACRCQVPTLFSLPSYRSLFNSLEINAHDDAMTSMRLSSLPSFAVVRKQTDPLRTVKVGPIQVAATWDSSMRAPQAPQWCGYYHNIMSKPQRQKSSVCGNVKASYLYTMYNKRKT